MSLVNRLEEEVKDAMRARDNERRDALRLILSSLKSAEKELLRPLSEDEELQVMQRERKRRNEAADAFQNAVRAGPQPGTTWMGLAISLEALGRRADAAQAYKRALSAGPLTNELRDYAESRMRALE